MSTQEKAIYLSEKYNVSYWYAMDILKANDYDLMLAGGYFRDMEQGLIMVEFFALSVIRAINARLPMDVETFLKPDVDAQNAIVFEWEHGVIYWHVSASLSTSQIIVLELHLDKNYDLQLEHSVGYDTINHVIETLVKQIKQIKGL